MKVCFLTTSFPRNERDTYATFVGELAKHLVAQNVDIDVVTSSDSSAREENWNPRLRVHRFSYFLPNMQLLTYQPGGVPEQIKNNFFAKVQLFFYMIAFISKSIKFAKNCDVLHAHWTLSGLVGVILKKIYGKPLVITIREGNINAVVRNPLLVFALKNADAVLINNDEYKESIISAGVDPAKIYKILNGIDAIFKPIKKLAARKKLNLPFKKRIVLFAGTLIARKNPLLLLEAVKNLLEETDSMLVIVGDGPLKEELMRKAKEASVESRILFVKRVPFDEMPLWYSAADIFAFPTLADGIPNVVSEAMSCGTAAVCTDLLSVHETMKDGYNVLLFKPGSVEELRGKLRLLLKGAKLRATISKHARETIIKRKLTWENCAEQHIKMYAHTLSKYGRN